MGAFRAGLASLPAAGSATETNFELEVLELMRRGGLPEPVLQHRVIDGDGRTRYLDFAYPELRLGAEADGDLSHSTPEDKARDAERDVALGRAGWHIEHVTEADARRRSAATLSRLRRSLSARARMTRSG